MGDSVTLKRMSAMQMRDQGILLQGSREQQISQCAGSEWGEGTKCTVRDQNKCKWFVEVLCPFFNTDQTKN